jgi:putative thioredoxin
MDGIIGQSTGANATHGDAVVFEASQTDFAETVIGPSQETPVIVDFWAPWCEPCKTLMPAMEQAVRARKGAVKLAKVNVDENQALAQQLQIQSIPAVFAFYRGRPIDGFMGAVPESQLKAFVDRVAAAAGPSQEDELVAMGQQALKEGNIEMAAQAFSRVLQGDPEHVDATVGLARCLLESGRPDDARQLVEQLPEEKQCHPEIVSVLAAIALKARAGQAAGEIDGLRARVAADTADHQARIDLAAALAAVDERDEAVDVLIASIKADRTWNDDAARKALIKLFDAFGAADPATLKGRRKLSTVLFS